MLAVVYCNMKILHNVWALESLDWNIYVDSICIWNLAVFMLPSLLDGIIHMSILFSIYYVSHR